jgi:hypothetical protein
MEEEKKKKLIIEPLWYIEHLSKFTKRNQKAPWELIIPIFLPVFIIIFFTQIPTNIISKQVNNVATIILLPILVLSFYYFTRKYIVEREL